LFGDPDGTTEVAREAYRPGQVVISGLVWCVMKPPRTTDGPHDHDGSRIDAGPVSELKEPPPLPAVPRDAFSWWFFVANSNSFIYIAASDATLTL
jgi:hypothetical protein